MKTYTDLLQKIESIKLENTDLVNFNVVFTGTTIVVEGEWFDNGKSEGVYLADIAAYFYIPTDKGYLSSKWKNSALGKIKSVEVNEELFNSLIPFLQPRQPKHFIRKTEGWGAAGAIANFITKTGGDIYCNK